VGKKVRKKEKKKSEKKKKKKHTKLQEIVTTSSLPIVIVKCTRHQVETARQEFNCVRDIGETGEERMQFGTKLSVTPMWKRSSQKAKHTVHREVQTKFAPIFIFILFRFPIQ
jgi:hypothetical protein